MYNPAEAAHLAHATKKLREKNEEKAKKDRIQRNQEEKAKKDRIQRNQNAFFKAAENGSANEVQRLLNTDILGIDVPGSGWSVSPLWIACQNGHFEVVTMLLDAGASCDLNDSKGMTPLYIATSFNHLDCIKALIKAGAEINICRDDGYSPLYAAVTNNQLNIAELLLINGARVKGPWLTENKVSPLFLAAESGKVEMANLLMKHGMAPDEFGASGWTPFHIAIAKGHGRVVDLFLLKNKELVHLLSGREHASPPLTVAVQNNQTTKIAEILINYGADVNQLNKAKCAPLHYVQDSCPEMFDLLMQIGAKLDLKDVARPFLHSFVIAGRKLIVEKLLQHNVPIDELDETGISPLMLAAGGNHSDLVELLIKNKAQIDLLDSKKTGTALFYASLKNAIDAAQVLINHGANLGVGLNPLFTALKHHHFAMAKLLVSSGKFALLDHLINSFLEDVIQKGDIEGLSVFVQATYDLFIDEVPFISAYNHLTIGGTLLGCAVWHGQLNVANFLIQQSGVNVDAKDTGGHAPLHTAAQKGYIEIAEKLITEGANLDITDEFKETPLHYAVRAGHPVMVDYLLQSGAHPHYCSSAARKQEQEPMELALALGKQAIIEAFIDYNRTHNNTILFNACLTEKTHILDVFFDSDSKCLVAKDQVGLSLLHVAVLIDSTKLIDYLLSKGVPIDIMSADTFTPLHYAIREGKKNSFSFLIDKGASTKLKTAQGFTAVHLAVISNNRAALELLIKQDCDLEMKDDGKDGLYGTPLHHAVRCGHTELAMLLLDNKANINARDNRGATPLHWAAKYGNKIMIQSLIERGAQIKITTKKGLFIYGSETPLHWAVRYGNDPELVQMLVQMGIDKNIRDSQWKTAADRAKELKKEDILLILKSSQSGKEETMEDCSSSTIMKP